MPHDTVTLGCVVDAALADVVVVLHFAFLLFVALGGFLAWRWPWVIWIHVPAVAWALGLVAIGYDCPLTPLEEWFRRRAGEQVAEGGFVDRYIEDVIYPERYTALLRAVVVVAVLVGWGGLVARRRRAAARLDAPHRAGVGPEA